jgi:hypothetical protein
VAVAYGAIAGVLALQGKGSRRRTRDVRFGPSISRQNTAFRCKRQPSGFGRIMGRKEATSHRRCRGGRWRAPTRARGLAQAASRLSPFEEPLAACCLRGRLARRGSWGAGRTQSEDVPKFVDPEVSSRLAVRHSSDRASAITPRPFQRWHATNPPSATAEHCWCLLGSGASANSRRKRRRLFSGKGATPNARDWPPGSSDPGEGQSIPRTWCRSSSLTSSVVSLASQAAWSSSTSWLAESAGGRWSRSCRSGFIERRIRPRRRPLRRPLASIRGAARSPSGCHDRLAVTGRGGPAARARSDGHIAGPPGGSTTICPASVPSRD